MEIAIVPVGALETNCYVLSQPGRDDAVLIDPGDDADKILSALAGKKVETEAAGHWRVTGDDCRVIGPLVAQCRLGQGRVTLVADVDFADPAGAAAGAAGGRAIDSLLAQLQRKD